MLEVMEIPEAFKEFSDVFLALRSLHQMCNQQLLPHDYYRVIDNFRTSWYTLTNEYDISTTPKIHILLDHLEDYFYQTNMTLIKVTDKLCENMHKYLSKRLVQSMYHVKDVSNPNHGARLIRALRHLNTYNLCKMDE